MTLTPFQLTRIEKNLEHLCLTAAEEGDLRRVEKIISSKVISVNCTSNSGLTPLHVAVRKGHARVISYLASMGADLNSRDKTGWAPLHYAVSRPNIVRLLLGLGADPLALTAYNETTLHRAVYSNAHASIPLLVHAGCPIDALDNGGRSALSLCSTREVAESLMFLGADAIIGTVGGMGVIAYHRMHRRRDIADIIRDALPDFWSPHYHVYMAGTLRRRIMTIMCLWSWNRDCDVPNHEDSPFVILSLELLFEVFTWLAICYSEEVNFASQLTR